MSQEPKQIIIKRIKKISHHKKGGGWKVAYADFVTAMMALFLLLWLLTNTPEEKKYELVGYFNDYRIFKPSGDSLMKEGSLRMKGVDSKEMITKDAPMEINRILKVRLERYVDNLVIRVVGDKVRIHLIDNVASPMFQSGSAELNDTGKEIIGEVAKEIAKSDYMMSIEGHTDAHVVPGGPSNWKLSLLRADSARIELERNGIDPKRFESVIGYGATKPLFQMDSTLAQNRRVSLVLIPGPDNRPSLRTRP